MSINKLHLTAITTTIDNKQECSSWREEEAGDIERERENVAGLNVSQVRFI